MNTFNCVCTICGKGIVVKSDEKKEQEQFVVCDECQNALNSDREEVGDDNGNS